VKVRGITYTEDEEIDTITVTMSEREAAAIMAIAGKLNDQGQRSLGLDVGRDDLYRTLAIMFNGHYEDGHPAWGPYIDKTIFAPLNGVPA
jgi:hypothetical protein